MLDCSRPCMHCSSYTAVPMLWLGSLTLASLCVGSQCGPGMQSFAACMMVRSLSTACLL